MLNRPITEKQTATVSTTEFRFAVCSMQGWRKGMEDAHTIQYRLGGDRDCCLAGVFDGHAGSEVAELVAEKLPVLFSRSLPFRRGKHAEALAASFCAVEDVLAKNAACLESGTTANAVVLTPTHVVCANSGDSRAVLCRGGEAVNLSLDHRPNDPVETGRITRNGGTVDEGRIGGMLGVSRAIGDFQLKPPLPRKGLLATLRHFALRPELDVEQCMKRAKVAAEKEQKRRSRHDRTLSLEDELLKLGGGPNNSKGNGGRSDDDDDDDGEDFEPSIIFDDGSICNSNVTTAGPSPASSLLARASNAHANESTVAARQQQQEQEQPPGEDHDHDSGEPAEQNANGSLLLPADQSTLSVKSSRNERSSRNASGIADDTNNNNNNNNNNAASSSSKRSNNDDDEDNTSKNNSRKTAAPTTVLSSELMFPLSSFRELLAASEFTAIPDVTQTEWDAAQDEFIVIACDGVWDMYTSQEIINMLRPAVMSGANNDLGFVLEEVLDKCLAPAALGPGTDNFTILVIAPTETWRERAKAAAAAAVNK